MEDTGGLIEFQECKLRFWNAPFCNQANVLHTLEYRNVIPQLCLSWKGQQSRFGNEYTLTHGSLWRWSQFIHLGKDRSQTQNMGRNKALVGLLSKCCTERKNKAFTHSDPSSGLQRQHPGELTLLLLVPAIYAQWPRKIFRSTFIIGLDIQTSGGSLSMPGLTCW